GIPQPFDHGAVGVHAQGAADAGEKVMALGGETGDSAAAAGTQLLHEHIVGGGEEPDRGAAFFRDPGHRPGVAVFLAVKAEHHGAVALKRLPEFLFEFAGVGHDQLQWVWSIDVITATVIATCAPAPDAGRSTVPPWERPWPRCRDARRGRFTRRGPVAPHDRALPTDRGHLHP